MSVEPAQSIGFSNLMGSGLPSRLKIPKLGIDALIEEVGLTPQGAVDVPKGIANAAWFNRGQRPGENGSAIIAGHFGWKDGVPAVFDTLHKLQTGDRLYIEDVKGRTTTFVVRTFQTYGQDEKASDVFDSSDGKAHLNLVTCEGTWDEAKKSYPNRLVVFTDKE